MNVLQLHEKKMTDLKQAEEAFRNDKKQLLKV